MQVIAGAHALMVRWSFKTKHKMPENTNREQEKSSKK